jgi:hypothetical protein
MVDLISSMVCVSIYLMISQPAFQPAFQTVFPAFFGSVVLDRFLLFSEWHHPNFDINKTITGKECFFLPPITFMPGSLNRITIRKIRITRKRQNPPFLSE